SRLGASSGHAARTAVVTSRARRAGSRRTIARRLRRSQRAGFGFAFAFALDTAFFKAFLALAVFLGAVFFAFEDWAGFAGPGVWGPLAAPTLAESFLGATAR